MALKTRRRPGEKRLVACPFCGEAIDKQPAYHLRKCGDVVGGGV